MSAVLDKETLSEALRNPVRLIAELFTVESGARYGEVWAPFQEEFFEAIFATLPDGRPKHRLLYNERRRGESKTEDMAAAALADLVTGPKSHHSYAVAADLDQAGLVMDSIQGFRARSPVLGQVVDVERWKVRNKLTGSELRIMSADDRTAFGIRPRRVYFDELSLQENERLWLAMWSAVGKKATSQMVAVSMAGWDFSSLGWRIRELAQSTPAYYFATREGTELAPWLSKEQMAEQEATLHPADYSRFWLCRWTEPMGSWLTREMFDSASVGQEAVKGDPQRVTCGFVDVGLVRDPTAIAVAHMEGDRVVLDTMRTLQGSRNEPVELAALEELVIDLTKRFHVSRWIFESPQAVASVQRLQKRLTSASVTVRYPTSETQGRLFGGLYQLFANQRIVLYPHDQLRREALNLVTKTVGGRLKVVESSGIHQDHVVALGGCADMLLEQAEVVPNYPAVAVAHRDPFTGVKVFAERLVEGAKSLLAAPNDDLPPLDPNRIIDHPEDPRAKSHPASATCGICVVRQVEAMSYAGQQNWPMVQVAGTVHRPDGRVITGTSGEEFANAGCYDCGRESGHAADCPVITGVTDDMWQDLPGQGPSFDQFWSGWSRGR